MVNPTVLFQPQHFDIMSEVTNMPKQEGNTVSNTVDTITDDTQQESNHFIKIMDSFHLYREDMKDLSNFFTQITITGYDFETGLDINGCTFEKVWKKCDVLPSCIKFTDTKQYTGEILPKELVNLPDIVAIDISECGIREIPKVLLQINQLRVLKATDNHISSLPENWFNIDLVALDISKNPICEVNSSIAQLSKLQVLLMADCNLKDFPHHTLQLKILKVLVLDDNPIGLIDEPKHLLDNMQSLSLENCLLPDISGWKLQNLRHLNASKNSIQCFPTQLGKHITELKLNNNQLDIIPDEVSLLQNLATLEVSNCRLKEFPASVVTLKNIKCLDISTNFIHTIPDDIVKLDLTKLLIGGNPLDEFPEFLDNLLNLEMIDLSSCFLEHFPFRTLRLQKLTKIIIDDNCLAEIPDDICQLELTKISMKGNPLNKLPDSFHAMEQLCNIDFSSTNINEIPRQILNLGNLRVLDMRNNAIEQLPNDWNKCVNITCLDLSENPLFTIPASFGQLQKVEILKLESCCLSEFPEVLLQLQSLQDLDLGHNLLSSLPDKFDKLHLKRLNLQDNLFRSLPQALGNHSKLQYLNLSSCRFNEWPPVISKLRNLKDLYMSGNLIHTLPRDLKSCDVLTLSLGCNPLENLTESLEELKGVVKLFLTNCLLRKIPAYFETFTRMSKLDISSNYIPSAGITKLPPHLMDLHVGFNPLDKLPETLWHVSKLTHLSARSCGLTEISTTIGNLRRLQELDVGFNNLPCLPLELKYTMLCSLDICDNPLRHLPFLEELANLTELNVSSCQLKEFPKGIFKLKRLTKISLDYNSIRTLPNEITSSNLTSLSIRSSRLKTLPNTFNNFKTLHVFQVGRSNLQDFPHVLLDVPGLTELSISIQHPDLLRLPTCWEQLQHLKQLDCSSCSNLIGLKSLKKLANLRIWTKESKIPMEAVQSKFLKTLNISFQHYGMEKNTIPNISNSALLIDLQIRANKLTYLPDTLATLTKLEKLSVTNSNLKVYPDRMSTSLRKLRILNLADNSLSSLPKVWCCKRLVDLDLAGATLENQTDFVTQLNNLTRLNISKCRLTVFPTSLLHLNKLKDLDISDNYISELPADLSNLQLLSLTMADNSLAESWPLKSIEQLSELVSLDISGNELEDVPESVLSLKCLRSLNVSNNPIRTFSDEMRILHNLRNFEGSVCELEHFPEFLLALDNIRRVSLAGNRIKEIPSHWNPLYLTDLCLNNNDRLQFNSDTLSGIGALSWLQISSCRLTEIPCALLHIPVLRWLDIENNSITRISEEMYKAIQMIPDVKISTAILTEPPKEIYEADEEIVEQYYKDLNISQACKVGFHNVVLLGSTTAGKTSLIKSLIAQKSVLTKEKNRTIAVDEETWKLMGDLHFHIIDFGGHDVYELVYPIFLKDREASIIIAVDLSTISDANIEQNLFKWLHTVLSLTGDSSEIIVVGTKSDKCSDEPEKMAYVRKSISEWIDKTLKHANDLLKSKEFPEHKRLSIEHFKKMAGQEIRSFATSSFSWSGLDKLKKVLLNQSREKVVKLPGSWFDLYKKLSDLKSSTISEGYLHIEKIPNLCEKLTSVTITSCLSYLHQRGMVLWYGKEPQIRNYVFYDITFIISILKRLLSHNLKQNYDKRLCKVHFKTKHEQNNAVDEFVENGLASQNLLKCILEDFVHTDEMYNLALYILKMFSLCYEENILTTEATLDKWRMSHGDTKILLFPWFLQNPINKDEYRKLWPEKIPFGNIPLKCIFTYEHCIPTSLYEQFSVQLHSKLTKYCNRKDWKNTIYVNQNAIELVVQAIPVYDTDQDRASLVIEMKTKIENYNQMYKMCMSVVKIIQSLTKVFPGILYDEEYVCPHCILTNTQNPTTLPLDDALEGVAGETKFVYCKNNGGTEIPAALHYPKLSGICTYLSFFIINFILFCFHVGPTVFNT